MTVRRQAKPRAVPVELAGVIGIVCAISGGCGETPTQLVVAVDSDLEIPAEIDGVEIEITGPSGESRRSAGALATPASLPALVTMVHRQGPLGTVTVDAHGTMRGSRLVSQRAVTSFVEGRVLVLPLSLRQRCVGVTCAEEQTCRDGSCVDTNVSSSELSEWTGDLSRGRSDGGVDGGGAECTVACPSDPPNASSTCRGATCSLTCDDEWDDCNGDPGDGCEALLSSPATCGACDTSCANPTPLCERVGDSFQCVDGCIDGSTLCASSCVDLTSSSNHCGACDRECTAPRNASPQCSDSTCGFTCDEQWDDCDGDPTNGCEARLDDVANCGSCATVCDLPNATEACAANMCTLIRCDLDRGDCDRDPNSGCEVDLLTDPAHCGSCGDSCPADPPNASYRCQSGGCALICDPGFADCDDAPANGCEANLGRASSCGACGVRCVSPAALCRGNASSGFACSATCPLPNTVCGTSCVDLTTDATHCGGCNSPCPDEPGTRPACTGGSCGITCNPGRGDCDAQPSNGCESSLTTLSACGACGAMCAPPQAAGTCSTGVCQVDTCEPGFGDCDGQPSNGCELPLTTTANCGACGLACPASAPGAGAVECVGGRCTATCEAGLGDCDGMVANGCEANLATLTDCGSCDTPCSLSGAQETCDNGTCRIQTCDSDRANCDGAQGNGCETDITSDNANCGACGFACAGGTSCCGGECEAGPCA